MAGQYYELRIFVLVVMGIVVETVVGTFEGVQVVLESEKLSV